MFYVAVVGQIGSGKSTFCKALRTVLKSAGVKVFFATEDVAAMQCAGDEGHEVNCLDLLYTNPTRFKGSCQLFFRMLRFEAIKAAVDDALAYEKKHPGVPVVVVSDRSLRCDRIFMQAAMNSNEIHDIDRLNYQKLSDLIPDIEADLYVYLRTSVNICQQRIEERVAAGGRDEEKNIPVELLQQLHKLHESVYKGDKVFIQDNEGDVEEEIRATVFNPLAATVSEAVMCMIQG